MRRRRDRTVARLRASERDSLRTLPRIERHAAMLGGSVLRRVLAVRQDNNGDVTLVGPAVRALAARARVTLVCSTAGEAAARLLPGVDDVVVVRAEWIAADSRPIDPAQIAADVARLRDVRADEAFVFTSFHQSPLPTALLLRLAGVGRIAAVSVDYPGSLLDARVSISDDVHESERALAVVAAFGYALPPDDRGDLAYVALPARDPALPNRYVAVQPGATVTARAWRPERMRDLVARLCARGDRVVIVGSIEEIALGRAVAGDSDAIDRTGRTSYAQFASIVRDATALVVGNSSGIHVAGAVGTPVVSIFAPTIAPARFRPWHVPYALLGDHAIACAGCRARTCPIPGQPCIGCVTAQDAIRALDALLTKPREEVVA